MNCDAPGCGSVSLELLRRRAELIAVVRDFFREHGYWEVETPVLSRDCCVDAWLDPFPVRLGQRDTAYLQTSPEFAMKRLLCAGADRIFQITRSFRQDEVGRWHNPEFAILEWYAAGTDHIAQMDFVQELVGHLAQAAARCIPEFVRLSYGDAFRQILGVCPHSASVPDLLVAAEISGTFRPSDPEIDRDDLLNFLLAERIEPELKRRQAVFLFDYPASQAALARTRPSPFSVAERFELYLDGIEICNGYHELTDPDELRRRMTVQNEKRRRSGKPLLPVESRLLHEMAVHPLPECAGVALGLDRLLAWCLGRDTIRDVITFPFDTV